MLRVDSNDTLVVPPFGACWLSASDHGLSGDHGFCLQFECKGENDATIILKPFPGAKRWQHLQRQQGPAGAEQLAVEANYTIILGSHRNSKLKIEKNGDEKAVAAGLPGCRVSASSFTSCWINYSNGCVAIGTGAAGSSLSYMWQDPEPAIPDIQHVGLSCWDKHISYKEVQLLPPLAPAQLQILQLQRQAHLAVERALSQGACPEGQQQHPAHNGTLPGCLPGDSSPLNGPGWCLSAAEGHESFRGQCRISAAVPPLLQLVQQAIAAGTQPVDVCHILQLSEALLPRTHYLYEELVQLAGEWFGLLVKQHLQELSMLPADVLMDILHEPLLDVNALSIFEAVASWCRPDGAQPVCARAESKQQPESQQQQQHQNAVEQQALPMVHLKCLDSGRQAEDVALEQQNGSKASRAAAIDCLRSPEEVLGMLQLVPFALMTDKEQQTVLDHPFSKACPMVQQCLQHDMKSLQEYHNSHLPRSRSPGAHPQQQHSMPPVATSCSNSLKAMTGELHAPERSGVAAHQDHLLSPRVHQHTSSCMAIDSDSATAAVLQHQVSNICGASRTFSHRAGSGRLRGVGGSSRRRLAPSCQELVYVFDGDRNGVIHHIATEYGTKPWVNPVLSKVLEIKASSPPSRFTDAKALVSGQFLSTSFAGPQYIRAAPPAAAALSSASKHSGSSRSSSSSPSTWWQVDLGTKHRLVCNYYCIRHDGSSDGFVRTWALQGSNDLHHWLDLRRHVDDSTIRLPGQFGSWQVSGPAACMPFRAFRLVLTGPTQATQGETSMWTFCLSHWELYGYFYKLRTDRVAPYDQGRSEGQG